jgi:hypothetical protein
MKATLKAGLLVGASTLALGFLMASPAKAFDTVNWRWDADVDETVTKNVKIDIHIDPNGLAMVEDLQVFVGNVKAYSTVSDIDNFQPKAKSDHHDYSFDFSKSVPIDAVKDLASVVSAATAVANNTSITADTAVELHEGQFAFGGVRPYVTLDSVGGGNSWSSGNSNLDLAAILLIGLAEGGLTKAKIEAKSDVYDIKNASVDSSATAVANNLSVNVTATGPNRLLMGDVTQLAIADVTASSKVNDVTLSNYTNLGTALGRPIVSSVATAVGNNKTINVSAPAVH